MQIRRVGSSVPDSVLVAVPNRNQDTMWEHLTTHFHSQNVLFSDGWAAYNKVGRDYFAAHCKVNHSEEFVNYKEKIIIPETDVDKEITIGNKTYPCHI